MAILEKDYGVAPRSYREAFIKLAEKGVVRPGLALKMADLASLRNLIVHRYWGIDDIKIYESARSSGVGVIEEFISEVRRYVETKDP